MIRTQLPVKTVKTILLLVLCFGLNPSKSGAAPDYLNSILQSTENTIEKGYNRLSSGAKLLADDPANYAIYEKLTANLKQLERIIANYTDITSYYRSAEGYLETMIDLLQRIRELALQKTNAIFSDFERGIIDSEIEQTYEHILFVLKNADFNKKNIFGVLLEDEEIKSRFQKKEYYQLANIDNLLIFFIRQRSIYGVKMKLLEYQIQGKSLEKENMAGFRSTVHDIDYSSEISQFRRNHLLLIVNLLMLN